MQQSSDGTRSRLGVSLNHMAKKKKGKFFLELDEDQGLWKVGQGDQPAPAEPQPVTEPQQVAEPQQAAEPQKKSKKKAAPAAAPATEPVSAAPAREPISLVGFFDNRPAAQPDEEAAEPENTFAAANPLPMAMPGRRGPGPSLDMFKAMAREVKRNF